MSARGRRWCYVVAALGVLLAAQDRAPWWLAVVALAASAASWVQLLVTDKEAW